jgi:hypothetical protein
MLTAFILLEMIFGGAFFSIVLSMRSISCFLIFPVLMLC